MTVLSVTTLTTKPGRYEDFLGMDPPSRVTRRLRASSLDTQKSEHPKGNNHAEAEPSCL